jgi:hypothetical protein
VGGLRRAVALRYANPSTRRYYERDLAALFAFAGVDHPRLAANLDEAGRRELHGGLEPAQPQEGRHLVGPCVAVFSA